MTFFSITDGKGFSMKFANGWAISVQFGWGNYSDNYEERQRFDETRDDHRRRCGAQGSTTAECAVFAPTGEMVKLPAFMFAGDEECRDIVSNRSSSALVLQLMNWTAEQPGLES